MSISVNAGVLVELEQRWTAESDRCIRAATAGEAAGKDMEWTRGMAEAYRICRCDLRDTLVCALSICGTS